MSYGGFEYGGGGFGGDGGFSATPVGGGGYMAGGAVDSLAPGGGGGMGGGGQRNRDKQSILSVNIKQVGPLARTAHSCLWVQTMTKVLESNMPSQDSAVKIDGVEVAQIKVVGCIVELEDASTNTEYTIEDTTGRLKVKIFHSDGEGVNDRSAERRARNQIGTYVRVFGNVRSWNGDRHSVAYDMQPITDFNEVTMHSLEIIYTHLFNTKGPLPGKATISGGAGLASQSMQGVGSPGFHAQGGQPFASPANNYDKGNGAGMGGAAVGGYTDIQQKVHDEFMRMDDEQGRSVDQVIEALRPSGISPHDVQSAVAFLSSEGHLYSTIDDNHYRSTDA